MIFDSNRTAIALGAPLTSTDSDLFLINYDGTSDSDLNPTPVTRGSSATWRPDGKWIAFHRSRAGGYGPRISGRGELGGPTRDSDIFLANLDDLLAHGEEPINLTESSGATSEDDADWSPAASRSHSPAGALYALTVPPAGRRQSMGDQRRRHESATPDVQQSGGEVAGLVARRHQAHVHVQARGPTPFEICVMNSDGSGGVEVLTNNTVPDLTPGWSPDGTRISFFRGLEGRNKSRHELSRG